MPVTTESRPARATTRDLFIAHEPAFAQPGGKAGGAAHVVRMQAEALGTQYTPVRIISPRPKGATVESHDLIAELFDSPDTTGNDGLLLELARNEEWRDHFAKLLGKGDPSVYAHYYVAGDIASELRNDGRVDRPLVYMGHSWDRVVATMDPHRSISPIRDDAERRILSSVDGVIVATEAERRLLADAYRDSIKGGEGEILAKTSVVPLGVDKRVFNPESLALAREEARRKFLPADLENSTNFFMLGRISPQKSQVKAVQGFAEVARDPALDISLSIFGGPLKGEYFERVQAAVDQAPEHVRRKILFHDVQPAADAFASGDIFFGPSVWETWFLSLSEAMASGKPTIASNKPILREVGGEGTLYVDETSIESIAGAVQMMATQPAIRQLSITANIMKAHPYTWENSARALQRVLDRHEQQRSNSR